MIEELSTSDPYGSLYRDLYSVGLFDQNINGLLSIIERNDKYRTILIERKFVNDSGSSIASGYYFVQCLSSICEEEDLKQFRSFLEIIVKEKANGNYMEVDPILIAPGCSNSVLSFTDQYNRIQKRKPIQLFRYGD